MQRQHSCILYILFLLPCLIAENISFYPRTILFEIRSVRIIYPSILSILNILKTETIFSITEKERHSHIVARDLHILGL